MNSTKSEHTPGPWVVFYKHKYGEGHVSIPNPAGGMSSDLCPDGVQTGNSESDARLIAAAPDLLAALEAIVSCYGVGWKDATSFIVALADLITDARAAIAKTRGES